MPIYLGGPVNDTPPGIFIGTPGPTIFRNGTPAPPAFERVVEPLFASATGYSFPGVTWVIAAGTATNSTVGPGNYLTATLLTPTVGGESYSVDLGVAANPAGTGVTLQLFNTSTLATQLIISETAPAGLWNFTGTVTGVFDAMRIRADDDPGLALNKFSLIA